MSVDLVRLVYLSENLIEGDEVDQNTEIGRILLSSRANNEGSGVTGALLFNAGYFAQALEGSQAAVDATFERIERDPRHGHLAVLGRGEARKREFADWSMAYVHPSAERTEAQWAKILEDAFLNPRGSQDDVLSLLRSLVGTAA